MADIDVREMFDSNYVAAVDLHGKDVVVVIAKVVAGELAKAGTSKKDKAPIIFFDGKEKGMSSQQNEHARNCRDVRRLQSQGVDRQAHRDLPHNLRVRFEGC